MHNGNKLCLQQNGALVLIRLVSFLKMLIEFDMGVETCFSSLLLSVRTVALTFLVNMVLSMLSVAAGTGLNRLVWGCSRVTMLKPTMIWQDFVLLPMDADSFWSYLNPNSLWLHSLPHLQTFVLYLKIKTFTSIFFKFVSTSLDPLTCIIWLDIRLPNADI